MPVQTRAILDAAMGQTKPGADNELLVVALPSCLEAGSMLQVLGVAPSLRDAEQLVQSLDTSIIGRVGVLEKKKLFLRQQVIESVEIAEPIMR